MPWHCPVCCNIIRHDESERTPRAGARYRCHVCRLGLEYEPDVNKMIVVRTDDDVDAPQGKQSRSR